MYYHAGCGGNVPYDILETGYWYEPCEKCGQDVPADQLKETPIVKLDPESEAPIIQDIENEHADLADGPPPTDDMMYFCLRIYVPAPKFNPAEYETQALFDLAAKVRFEIARGCFMNRGIGVHIITMQSAYPVGRETGVLVHAEPTYMFECYFDGTEKSAPPYINQLVAEVKEAWDCRAAIYTVIRVNFSIMA